MSTVQKEFNKAIKLNAKLIDYKFQSCCHYEHDGGYLELIFSNGMVLEIYVLYGKNGNMKLSSQHTEGELIARLSIGEKEITCFELTKTNSTIKENGVFVKKFTSLKYWIYIKSKHFERKQIISKIKK